MSSSQSPIVFKYRKNRYDRNFAVVTSIIYKMSQIFRVIEKFFEELLRLLKFFFSGSESNVEFDRMVDNIPV